MTETPPNTEEHMTLPQALHRAHGFWDSGLAAQAESLLRAILATIPNQPDAHNLLGVMAHAYGQLDMGIEHLRQACRAPHAMAHHHSNLAEMCRQKGLLTESEEAARKAVALDQNQPGGWNNLGIILQQSGQFEESRQCLLRALALQPDWPEAHNNLANTCKRLNHLDEADEHYRKAIELNPDYAEAHCNHALLLRDRGDLDEAAELIRRGIDLSPGLPSAYINLAGVEISRCRHGEALRWLDTLLTFAPNHPGAQLARATCLTHMGQLDQALESVRQAMAEQPQEDAEAHQVLGEILHRQGQAEDALAALDKAITLPGIATETALGLKAEVLTQAGRQPEAATVLRELQERFPGSAIAARLSTLLDQAAAAKVQP